ncbi:VirB8/TrbF family protein [Rhodospirillum sp. A1_3_36]|uniref:VirB8/TrbF family protein n=1 Tax=Rhodospirillum sp. A1_3_36 TaxID=3391666 RepID=UPI0039A652FB
MARLTFPWLARWRAKTERVTPTFSRVDGDPVLAPPARPHAKISEADPFAFQAAHRRLAWMLRLSVATNIGLLATVVVQGNAIGALVPLKTTEVALVRGYEPDDKLYQIEPISEDVNGFDLLLEATARRYVRLVLEIDRVTEGERRAEAARMSDAGFWRSFVRDRIETKERTDALSDGMVRQIQVGDATRLYSLSDDYKLVVDFEQIDERHGKEIERKPLRAYLSMTTRPQSVSAEDRFANPLGLTVLDFVLRERPSS